MVEVFAVEKAEAWLGGHQDQRTWIEDAAIAGDLQCRCQIAVRVAPESIFTRRE
jgi:hypothetical protein